VASAHLIERSISAADAVGKTADKIGDVADAFARIEDPAERVRLAFKLFDSEGVALVNLLSGSSDALEEMRDSKTASTSSVLDADLDLRVYDPDGNLLAWSSSWDSSFELVEFTPPKAGAYKIRVRGYSVPSDFSSYYGVAWTTHYDLCP